MKKKNYSALLFCLFFCIFFYNCQDDLADLSKTDSRDNIVGTWNVKEYSETFKEQNYTINISKDALDTKKIKISNFFNLGNSYSVSAQISNLTITIPNQKVKNNDVTNGSGTITSSYQDIDLEYYMDFGSGPEKVSAQYTSRPVAKAKDLTAMK
jgi:hypothetical protein